MRIAVCELGGRGTTGSLVPSFQHAHREYISRLIHTHICTYIQNIIYGGGREGGRDHNLTHTRRFFFGGVSGVFLIILCVGLFLSLRGRRGRQRE